MLFSLAVPASAYTLQFADEGKAIRLRWKNSSIPIALSSSFLKPNPNIKPESDVLGAVRRRCADHGRQSVEGRIKEHDEVDGVISPASAR